MEKMLLQEPKDFRSTQELFVRPRVFHVQEMASPKEAGIAYGSQWVRLRQSHLLRPRTVVEIVNVAL